MLKVEGSHFGDPTKFVVTFKSLSDVVGRDACTSLTQVSDSEFTCVFQVNWNAGCVNKDVRMTVGRAVYVMNSVGFCYPSCPVREEGFGVVWTVCTLGVIIRDRTGTVHYRYVNSSERCRAD